MIIKFKTKCNSNLGQVKNVNYNQALNKTRRSAIALKDERPTNDDPRNQQQRMFQKNERMNEWRAFIAANEKTQKLFITRATTRREGSNTDGSKKRSVVGAKSDPETPTTVAGSGRIRRTLPRTTTFSDIKVARNDFHHLHFRSMIGRVEFVFHEELV